MWHGCILSTLIHTFLLFPSFLPIEFLCICMSFAHAACVNLVEWQRPSERADIKFRYFSLQLLLPRPKKEKSCV